MTTNRAAVETVYRLSAGGTIVLAVVSALHFILAGGRGFPPEAILVVPFFVAALMAHNTLHPEAAAAPPRAKLPEVNPATGLPSRNGLDVGGNPFGFKHH